MKLKSTAVALACATALAVPAVAQAGEVTLFADGLDNPRGLALAPDGALYVASAGRAGPTCPEKDTCFGFSSRVTAFQNGRRQIVADGLLSVGGTDGTFTSGADGVSVGPDGRIVTVITSGEPDDIAKTPAAVRRQAGDLFNVSGGERKRIGRIDSFEWRTNADRVKGDRNSNPYAVLALDGHDIVADAGANSLVDVRAGKVSLLAVMPKVGKAQAVPTSLAQGPDGAIYVGLLAEGAGPKKASVMRVPLEGGTPSVFRTGFTAITGIAFGQDGSLYVTELATNLRKQAPTGRVVRVAPDNTRTTMAKDLGFPAGLAVDPAGNAYVSNFSVLPRRTPKKGPFQGAGGHILKIAP